MVHRLVGVRGAHGCGEGTDGSLEAVGPADDGGHRPAVEALGQGVPRRIALETKAHSD